MIIGVMTALVGPGLGAMIADNRQSSATEEIVRLHRHVRARVVATGLAHLVIFSATANGGLGTLTVWEGMHNRCSTTNWESAVGAGGASNGHFPTDRLLMDVWNPKTGSAPTSGDSGRHVITLRASRGTTATTGFALCFQPNGQAFEDTSVDTTWAFAPQRVAYVLEVERTVNTIRQGLNRRVVFPLSGTARQLI